MHIHKSSLRTFWNPSAEVGKSSWKVKVRRDSGAWRKLSRWIRVLLFNKLKRKKKKPILKLSGLQFIYAKNLPPSHFFWDYFTSSCSLSFRKELPKMGCHEWLTDVHDIWELPSPHCGWWTPEWLEILVWFLHHDHSPLLPSKYCRSIIIIILYILWCENV